jgi:hypothetical protein
MWYADFYQVSIGNCPALDEHAWCLLGLGHLHRLKETGYLPWLQMLWIALSVFAEVECIPCLFARQCCGLHFEWRLMLVDFVLTVWSIVPLDVLYISIIRKGRQGNRCFCVCCSHVLETPSVFPVRLWMCHEHNVTSREAWAFPSWVLCPQSIQQRMWHRG